MAKQALKNPELIQFKMMVISSKGTIGDDFFPNSAFWENMVTRQQEIREGVQFSYDNHFKSREKAIEAIEHGGAVKFFFQGRKKYSEAGDAPVEKINRITGRNILALKKAPSKHFPKYLDGLDRFPIMQEYKIRALELIKNQTKSLFPEKNDLDGRGEVLMQIGASFTTFFSPTSVVLAYEAASAFAALAIPEVESKLEILLKRQTSSKKSGGQLSSDDQIAIEILEYNKNELASFLNNKALIAQGVRECQGKPALFIDYRKLQSSEGVEELCRENQHSNITDLMKTLTQYRNSMNIGFIREAMNQVLNDIIHSPVLQKNPTIQLSKLRNDYEKLVQKFRTSGRFQADSMLQVIQAMENCELTAASAKELGIKEGAMQFHNMSIHRLMAMAGRFCVMRAQEQETPNPDHVQSMTTLTELHYDSWKNIIGQLKLKKEGKQKLHEELIQFKGHWDSLQKRQTS